MSAEFTSQDLAVLHGILDLAREGRTQELKQWLQLGISPELATSAGDTLLMLAAYHDHPATVAMLLEMGATPDIVNSRGHTPLGAAVFRVSTASVVTLLKHGADPDAGLVSAAALAVHYRLDEMTALLFPGAQASS